MEHMDRMVFICWQQWHTGLLAHLANNGELVMQLTQCDPRTMHTRMVYKVVYNVVFKVVYRVVYKVVYKVVHKVV